MIYGGKLMFKDKFLIFIILVIALLSIGVASAEESSINVTSGDDLNAEVVTSMYDENTSLDVASEDNSIESGDDNTFSNKSFTQLNNTINSASDIKLDSNYKMAESEANNFTNGITISKNISINGNGFIIDANNLGRIFNINGDYTVSLTNITLANGKNSVGGAIIMEMLN